MKQKSRIDQTLKRYMVAETQLNDAVTLFELAAEAADDATLAEAGKELQKAQHLIEKLKLLTLLSGEADGNNAFLEIHAGAGGTESCDWANMLLRMYIRWAEREGYTVTLMDENRGEEAGIKGATLKIEGANSYGLLKTENGVHRLVRISPFDSQNRRHTSFASVFAYPEIDSTIEIEVRPEDVRVDTYRASGAGGQHVNTTDSAIRMVHEPSGIVVTCQQDRSQHRNREIALEMLKARLYEAELRRQAAEKDATEAAKTDIGWGHQIRSYVLHPYQLVKDLRTSVETGNTQAVLDGDINDFIQAALAISKAE